MKDSLHSLLTEDTIQFTKNQIDFMISNIGSIDRVLRDDTIYRLFCRGFMENLFKVEQAAYITNRLLEEKLLLKIDNDTDRDSLTRSFTALVLTLILESDNDKESAYFDFLDETQREEIFQSGITFMKHEQDFRGYDEKLGWIHAVAHGADLLSAIVRHTEFSIDKREEIFWVIERILFIDKEQPFIDGEEERLGNIVINLRTTELLTESEFRKWINRIYSKISLLNWNELSSYYILYSCRKFFSSVYFALKHINLLEDETEKIIVTYINEYSD